MSEPKDSHQIEVFREKYRKLLFHVGRITSDYQRIEDSLPEFFATASHQSSNVALQIFELNKGLESKLRMITSVMNDRDESLAELWLLLRPEIKWAFDQRNVVAHSVPASWGGTVNISFDEQGEVVIDQGSSHDSGPVMVKGQFDVEKMKTVADMKKTGDQFGPIWTRLISLQSMLDGKDLPEHWAAEWDHPTVKNWPIR